MKKEYEFKVELQMHAPTLSQSSAGALFGMDASYWRVSKKIDATTAPEVYPALPASLIVGNLRHHWRRLATISKGEFIDADKINEWLGPERNAGDPTEQPLGRLYRDWAWIADRPATPGRTHRVKIDDQVGRAEQQMLQAITIPYPPGDQVQYRGSFYAVCDEEEAQRLSHQLVKGLQFAQSLGAFKGIGFGLIANIQITHEALVPSSAPALDPNARVSITLSLDRPFCVASPHASAANHLRSETELTGGIIKGAIATRLQELDDGTCFNELKQNLDRIWISHANPAPQAQNLPQHRRALPIPHSLYVSAQPPVEQTKQSESKPDFSINDAIGIEADQLADGSQKLMFKADWKSMHWQWIEPFFSGCNKRPDKQLQIRNAIKDGTNTAEDGALYSAELVNVDEHVWLAELDLGKVTQSKVAVFEQLASVLASGLSRIGKTRARAQVSLSSARPTTLACWNNTDNLGDSVRLLLTTPGDFFGPSLPDLSTVEQVFQCYARWFEEHSKSSLKLMDYYATQSLYGGDYYWHRFMKKSGAKTYSPLLMSDAGSVFLLSVQNCTGARAVLDNWARYGLRPEMKDNQWQHCPVICANGFGRVVIDPDLRSLSDDGSKDTV